MITRFGDLQPLSRNVPSSLSNLFNHNLPHRAPAALLGASFKTTTAPVGFNPRYGIPHITPRNPCNIVKIIACALSIILALWLIRNRERREDADGRVEHLRHLRSTDNYVFPRRRYM